MEQKSYRIFLYTVLLLVLVSSSCNAKSDHEILEATQAAQLTATKTFLVPTETQEPTSTPTDTPTKTPTQTPTEVPTNVISEEIINDLANQLTCTGSKGSCIRESTNGPEDEFRFEILSSGIFENIELRDLSSNETIATMTVLQGVSKDKNGEPIVVLILVQAEFFYNPGVSSFRGVYQSMLSRSGLSLDEIRGRDDLLGLEEWGELMPEGSTWTFYLKKYGTIYTLLEGTYYTSEEFNQIVLDAGSSEGTNISEDFLLIPSGMGP